MGRREHLDVQDINRIRRNDARLIGNNVLGSSEAVVHAKHPSMVSPQGNDEFNYLR